MRLNAPGLINESTDLGAVPMESRMIDGVLARQRCPSIKHLVAEHNPRLRSSQDGARGPAQRHAPSRSQMSATLRSALAAAEIASTVGAMPAPRAGALQASR